VLAPDSLVLDGRFRVIRPIGSGGMGEVYLGEQVSLERKVAIKVLHHDVHVQPGMLERFKREARLLSAVEHPAVVRIIDFGESEHSACLVMELVEGQSLYELLRTGPLEPARALVVLRQLAEGLSAIHDKGIIHRDIKPENVFLTRGPRGEQARLLDFGIARLVEPDADSNVSQVGVVLGTPEYLSPEQAIGARVDVRSDLYSLGVLAYRALSGRLPFDGPTPRHYIAQHANSAPLPLDRAAPALGINPTLVSMVMRLLEKDPANRFQHAHALADALAEAASGPLPASITPPGAPAPGAAAPGASGTAAFGGAPPVSSMGGAQASGAPPSSARGPELPPTGSGTAVFGGAPAAPSPVPPTGSNTAAFGGAFPAPSLLPPAAGGASLVDELPANFVPWETSEDKKKAQHGKPAAQGPVTLPWDTPPPPSPLPSGEGQGEGVRPSVPLSEPPLVSTPASSVTSASLSPPPAPAAPSAPQGKTQNLTLMLTSLQGFTGLREDHERQLETYESLLLPVLRDYEGKLIQKQGDVLLAVFGSPTGAVLCGMGMQDRLWRHNQGQSPESQLHARVCLHAGEVVLTRDSVLGEPMDVVRSAEQVALADEVTFTESVNLARNRAEVVAEPCGTIPLPAQAGPLKLYRSKRVATEGPPFGGRDEVSATTTKSAVLPRKPALGGAGEKLKALTHHPKGRLAAAGALGGLLLIGGVTAWLWNRSPEVQARRLLKAGKPAEALKRLDAAPAEDRKAPELRQVRAQALHALERHEDEHETLLALDAEGRQGLEKRVLDDLAEDFGQDEGDRGLRKLLGSLPKDRLHDHFEALAEGDYSPRQWGALRYLESAQDTEGLDLVELYMTSLASTDCGIRAKAARRLGALGDADAVPALEKLAQIPKEKVLVLSKNCGQDEAEEALQTLKGKSD
jgi:serine/threonine-protein kinase